MDVLSLCQPYSAWSPPLERESVAGQAVFVGEYGSLRAVGESQFGEDVGNVGLHGLVAQVEPLADLDVRHPFGDEPENFALALGQAGDFSAFRVGCCRESIFCRFHRRRVTFQSVPRSRSKIQAMRMPA